MRWLGEDGEVYSAPWEEPADPKAPGGHASSCGYVWAVPTQEGMALQLNSMVSVMTLGARLRRIAVIMPLLAVGPHYRSEVALRRMRATSRMSLYVNLSATAGGATEWVEFDDAYETIPRAATCVSCAGRPPPHVKCARGWDYDWCDRDRVVASRHPRCALRVGDGCGACVFSVGFTPGLQRADARWHEFRRRLRFADVYERAADAARSVLFGGRPYVALQMRRGDKSRTLDKAGLTVENVLQRTLTLARGMPVFVATDDRSNATWTKIRRFGFLSVDDPTAAGATALAAYLVDILLCVQASVFVGTATRRNKSKQLDLIKALRKGRHKAPRDFVLK